MNLRIVGSISFLAGTLCLAGLLPIGCSPGEHTPQQGGLPEVETGQSVDDCPVAQVGDADIRLGDLVRICADKESRMIGVPGMSREDQVRRIRYQILDTLLVRETLRQEAVRRGVEVADKEVTEWLDRAGTMADPAVAASMYPELAGLSEDGFREEVRTNLSIRRLMNLEVFDKVDDLTTQELQSHYDENLEDFRTPSVVKAFVLLVRKDKEGRSPAEARRWIQDIRHRLENDIEAATDWNAKARVFADYVRIHSEHQPTRKTGGYWVIYNRGQLGEDYTEMEEALYALPLRTLSPVHEMPNAFFIALVEERQERRLADFDEIQETLRRKIMSDRQKNLQKEFFEGLKEKYAIRVFMENLLDCSAEE